MPHEFSRRARVAELLRRELAELLMREIHDPRVRGVSVSDVSVSKNLAHANVFVSALDPRHVPEALEGLKSAAGVLRSRLGKRLNLRVVPQLRFQYDDTQIRAEQLDSLIDQARQEDIAHGSDDRSEDDS